jgi:CBS-domain-containing membrane protein
MIVEDVMQTSVTTITPTTPVTEAVRLVRRRGIRHLPVVQDDALVGIVSDRDLKRGTAASPETPQIRSLREALTVDEIMTRAVITVGRTFPIEEAARLMVTEKVGALPVTEVGRLIGIVTETDVLELFVKGMGAGEPSSRLDVQLSDEGQALADLVHAVEEARAEICSIMTLRDRSGHKDVVIRLRTIDPRSAIACLGARGYTVRTPRRD